MMKVEMYRVLCEGVKKECETLSQALEFASTLNSFVTISGGECDIVGMFGAAGVAVEDYAWTKRRKS
jgi:precorrin-3B methylase